SAQQSGDRHGAVLRGQGAASPGETGDYKNGDAAQIDGLGSAPTGGADQERHSGNAEDEPEDDFGDRTVAAWTEPVHDDQPKGNHGHEQRRYSRGDGVFVPTDAPVAHKQQQS